MPKALSPHWQSPPQSFSSTLPVGTRERAYSSNSEWFNQLKTYIEALLSELENPNQPERRAKISQADLPAGAPYQIVKDIPVKVIREGDIDYIATFEDANISIGGTSYRDAYQSLICELLDVFDRFTEERSNLGPEPSRQLKVLAQYIVKANR